MHQIECIVDLLQRHLVGDQVINVDFSVHVPINDLWHLGAALSAAKCSTFPNTASDQLEWTGGDLSACRRNTNDDRLAPTLVTAFKGLAHNVDITDALKTVVCAAFR